MRTTNRFNFAMLAVAGILILASGCASAGGFNQSAPGVSQENQAIATVLVENLATDVDKLYLGTDPVGTRINPNAKVCVPIHNEVELRSFRVVRGNESRTFTTFRTQDGGYSLVLGPNLQSSDEPVPSSRCDR